MKHFLKHFLLAPVFGAPIWLLSAALVILLNATVCHSQVTQAWVQTYNGPANGSDQAASIAFDDSGNVYVTGVSTGSGTGADVATIKYNAAGIEQWVRRYNGPDNGTDFGRAIAVDRSRNVYVTGASGTELNYDCTTIKYDSQGLQQWVRRYNGPNNFSDHGEDIEVDSSGNVYVTGHSQTDGPHNWTDYLTIKYNTSGAEQWVRRYNDGFTNNSNQATSLTIDSSGNVYVTGSFRDSLLRSNFGTIKYSASGVEQWVRIYNGPGIFRDDVAFSIAVDHSRNVYVTGSSATDSTSTLTDYATIKYNSAGAEQWVRRYDGPGNFNATPRSVAVDNSGNVFVTGSSGGGGTGFTTIKYNAAGVEQWVQRHNGSGGISLALDNSGDVYVTGPSVGNGTGTDYTTIKYNTAGVEQWVQRYEGPATDLVTSLKVDGARNVYVTGNSFSGGNSNYATIKYSQGLVITRPVAGERWIAGGQDTIRWTGRQPGQILWVDYSADSGRTYSTIFSGVNADSLLWTIPSSELTTRARIKITDIANPADTAISDTFKIKGYVLTRMTAQGHYEAFTPNLHGWNYRNGTLWPRSWWSGFNYATATDPNTNGLYPSFFWAIPDSTFIDWPLWVDVFSSDECYWSTSLGIYKGHAQQQWKSWGGKHAGSCYGFAASSFLAFNFRNQFFPRHPGIPNVANIFSLNLNNTIQKTINGYYAHQLGRQALNNTISSMSKSPRTTLQEIKNMLINDVVDIQTLMFYNNSPPGGHAVAPIGISMDPSGSSRYRVYVYDSNNPGLSTPYILIDSLNNTWADSLGLRWSGSAKLFLDIPVSNHLNTPVMWRPSTSPAIATGSGNIGFYNTPKANAVYTASNGTRIGYVNGGLIEEIPGGTPIIALNGKPSDPLGYYVPDDAYTAVLSNIGDATERVYLTAFKDSVVYSFDRANPDSSQVDRFRIGEGFSAVSPDTAQKQITLQVIAELDSSERIFIVRNTQLRQNDSLYLRELGESNLILKNYGSGKSYQLEINDRSAQEQEVFVRLLITLPANASHTIVPNWDDLDGSPVMIWVDLDNNGTIDDTLIVVNQATDVDDRGSLDIPTEYNLAQNYPNPFNPVTMIEYSLPHTSHVRLTVYNVLGQLVTTLVDEERPAGQFVVEWNGTGTNGARVGSGVYFYTMVAHGVSTGQSIRRTGKMILLK